MSITGSDDHPNSLSRNSGDFEPGRMRFSKFSDLKQRPDKENIKDVSQLKVLEPQNDDFEVPEERSRARAFCANWQDLLLKPTASFVNSFSSLDSVPEDSKFFEDKGGGSILEPSSSAWNISHNCSLLERDIPENDEMNGPYRAPYREFSHSLDMIDLLMMFRKTSARKSSEMIILRKSYSCSNLNVKETNKESPVKRYQCDFKIYIEGKQSEKSVIQNQSRRNTVSKLERSVSIQAKKVYNLKETQAYAHVSQAFQASRRENIFDQNRLEERISSDPFIVHASKIKGTKEKSQDVFTDIQWICKQKLIDEILSPKKADAESEEKRIKIKKTLIMSYDMVFSSMDLFDQLMRRFFIPSPYCMGPKETQFFEESVKEPAQMRVIDLILYWMKEREADFLENLSLRQLAMAYLKFATCVCSNSINEKLKELKNLLESAFENEHEHPLSLSNSIDVIDRVIIGLPSNPKSCQIWHINDSKSFHLSDAIKILFDFSPKQIAEQMTLIDSALHRDIRHWHMPHNLQNKLHTGKEGNDNPYKRLIEQTNYRTFFFVYLIIALNFEQKKLSVIARLLDIAKECVKIQNYQGYSCIVGALTNMAVLSQRIPWDALPANMQKRKKRYEHFYKNTRKLRKKIRDAAPPLVPCLMLVSLDLEKIMTVPAYLEESNKRLINFRSMEEIVLASDKFFSSQGSEFNYPPIHRLLEYFQEDVLRLMMNLNSELNINKIQAHLQALAKKPRS